MSSDHTILVLGGGVGGVVTAVELRKRLPASHRVVLVEREELHVFAPSLLWLMTGDRSPEKISRPIGRLAKRGIEVVQGEIASIDPTNRRIVVDGRTIEADHLVISLGADFAPEAIPGLPESGHNFCTLPGAEGLRDALPSFRSGRLVVMTAAPAYKCPAAPYEAAMLLEYNCRRRGVRDHVSIDLYTAEPGPMGVAGPEVSAAVRQMVESKGVVYHPEHQVTRVDPAAGRISFANGVTADFDLLVHVPPIRVPKVVREAGLTGESGWVPVDRRTMETRFQHVCAIGDVTGIPLKLGKPLPKAGVFAHAQASVVARNIARAVTGKGDAASFDGHGGCFIEVGHGRAGFGKGDFYAEPVPLVRMHKPGLRWHWGKVLFEKDWLRRWF
ncbi:MAG: FAD/NAD(P)-binding oxidoreductase [Myxococcota bacterium]|nr:FAD/NAD(P)-binding oxidoreductase [Myxococcota bacterium]